MEAKSIEKPKKVRHTFYLDPKLHRWLWKQRVETGRSVSEIGEELMVRQIRDEDRRPSDR